MTVSIMTLLPTILFSVGALNWRGHPDAAYWVDWRLNVIHDQVTKLLYGVLVWKYSGTSDERPPL